MQTHDENPFHTWWWRVWEWLCRPLWLFGFDAVLVRCSWTKHRCRVGLAFVGWGDVDLWGVARLLTYYAVFYGIGSGAIALVRWWGDFALGH